LKRFVEDQAMDQAFIRQMQKKVDEELRKKEREVLGYWRNELEKTIKRRHQALPALTTDLQTLLSRMDTRLSQL
jgi:hypothetical protein